MNIDFRIIEVIITIIVWFLLDILFVYRCIYVCNRSYCNPQRRSIDLTKNFWIGVANFILVIVLFFLKFKFWFICLFLSFGFMYFIFTLILYFIERIKDKFWEIKIKNKKTNTDKKGV